MNYTQHYVIKIISYLMLLISMDQSRFVHFWCCPCTLIKHIVNGIKLFLSGMFRVLTCKPCRSPGYDQNELFTEEEIAAVKILSNWLFGILSLFDTFITILALWALSRQTVLCFEEKSIVTTTGTICG